MAKVTKDGSIVLSTEEYRRVMTRDRSSAYAIRKLLRRCPNEVLQTMIDWMVVDDSDFLTISKTDVKGALARKILKGQE